MREILFRGKGNHDTKWVEGFYACFNGKEHRIYTGYAETDCGDYYPECFEVIPETVGQYTGLTDKNGVKIFEGDIIRAYFEPQNYKNPPYAIGDVIFENGTFKMSVRISKNAKEHKLYENENVTAYSIEHNFLDRHYVLEVIGNIHNNPELAEGLL